MCIGVGMCVQHFVHFHFRENYDKQIDIVCLVGMQGLVKARLTKQSIQTPEICGSKTGVIQCLPRAFIK